MDVNIIRKLNNNPNAKIAYLQSLAQLPNLSLKQQEHIYYLIQKTEQQVQVQQGINQFNQGTRSFNSTERLDNTQKFMRNVDMYSTEYKQQPSENFEAHIKMQRAEEMNKRSQQRSAYEQGLRNINSKDLIREGLTIFKLNPNYNEAELKQTYKRLAIEYHPDRPGGNKEYFQYITTCYKALLEKLHNSTTEKNFMELKKDYNGMMGDITSETNEHGYVIPPQMNNMNNMNNNDGFDLRAQPSDKFTDRYREAYTQRGRDIGGGSKLTASNSGFNTNMFNKMFEENKLWDPNDDGYGDWMTKDDRMTDEIEKPKKIMESGKGFNVSNFNSKFNDLNSQNSGGVIQKYEEPVELLSTSMSYTLVDGSKQVTDFSKMADSTGGIFSSGGLTYTDYKKAFDNGGANLLNTGLKADRPSYKSLEEFERARSEISYTMTPEQEAEYQRRKAKKEAEENERIERLRKHDLLYQQHYDNTHQRVLGFADSNTDGIKRLEY